MKKKQTKTTKQQIQELKEKIASLETQQNSENISEFALLLQTRAREDFKKLVNKVGHEMGKNASNNEARKAHFEMTYKLIYSEFAKKTGVDYYLMSKAKKNSPLDNAVENLDMINLFLFAKDYFKHLKFEK